MFLLVKVEMSQYCSLEEAYKIPVAKKVRPEGFTNTMKPLDKPYSSQYTDYDYMCKNSGICLTNPKETFSSSEKPKPAASCSPLTAPTYQYPFSEKDKEKFRKALKVALEQMENPEQPAPPPLPEPATQQEDAEFNGFVDKELEAYMMVNDMKDSVRVTTLPPAGPTPADFTPVVAGVSVESMTTTAVEKKPDSNFTKRNGKLFDLLLFIIAGILIILIMDQLFKLALLSGMDKTLKTIDKIIQSREMEYEIL